MAPLARKRIILSELMEKVEVGKGYQVTVHVKLSYKQFQELSQKDEIKEKTQANEKDENVAWIRRKSAKTALSEVPS